MSQPSFKVYIDESGDDGFTWDKGGSSWFTISAVVTRKSNDLQVVKLVDRVNQRLGNKIGTTLHFRSLKHERKLPYIEEITASPLRTMSIMVHKPSIAAPETFRSKRHRLYFYTVRYLLERVSWFCRDHRRAGEGDGCGEIVFSNRSEMKYDELRDYMRLLRERSGEDDVRIDWSAIDCDRISALAHPKSMGLQIADAVASGLQRAVEPLHGFTEDRYARMLRPVAYAYKGRCRNYGLKLWPGCVAGRIGTDPCFAWVREAYPK